MMQAVAVFGLLLLPVSSAFFPAPTACPSSRSSKSSSILVASRCSLHEKFDFVSFRSQEKCVLATTATRKNDDPLRPPEALRSLRIRDDQEIVLKRPYFDPTSKDLSKPQLHSYKVKRVARNSDLFLLKGFLTMWECEAIIEEAKNNYEGGMTEAMSEQDQDGKKTTARSHCKVAWLGDSRLGGVCGMIGDATTSSFIADNAKDPSPGNTKKQRSDMQVLNYKNGGRFVLHHDGKDRVLTVIYYLNGVAGTWFPLVDVGLDTKDESNVDLKCLEQAMHEKVDKANMYPGRNGVLISGKEATDATTVTGGTAALTKPNRNVVSIDAGDAVAFYSYQTLPNDAGTNTAVERNAGHKDWRAIHAGLPVEYAGAEGKWIATHWFQAPHLMANDDLEHNARRMYLANHRAVAAS